MIPDDLPFDQINLLSDDWDEIEDGEIRIGGIQQDEAGEEA